MVYALRTADWKSHDRGVLLDGDCNSVRNANMWIHVYINVASTLLLGASSFAMQCFSAPTREQINKAHKKRIWLDIGVPSLRNVRFMRRKYVIMWYTLAATSLVLHLLFNSTIFSTLDARSYTAYTLRGGVLEVYNGSVYAKARYMTENTPYSDLILPSNPEKEEIQGLEYFKTTLTTEDLLTKEECISAFGKAFVSDRRMIILDLSNETIWFSTLAMPGTFNLNTLINASYAVNINGNSVPENCIPDPTWWMCGSAPECGSICNYGEKNDWTPFGFSAERCFSPRLPESCRLEISRGFAITVSVVGLIKALVVGIGAFSSRPPPLLTIGDAVSSFLEHPDPTTTGACFLQKRDLDACPPSWTIAPKFWMPRRKHRIQAISRRKTTLYLNLYLLVTVIILLVLVLGFHNIKGAKNFMSLVSPSLWGMSVQTLITGPVVSTDSLFNTAMLANIAQPILSCLYFLYNGALTSMCLAAEWDQFGANRKSLRVSGIPTGSQRCSYSLQLPFRFGIPLMAISGALHWLASQCIFMVSIIFVDQNKSAFILGYSVPAISSLLLLSLIMFAYAGSIASYPLKNGIPVVGSCSAAISAACHPESDGKNPSVCLPVMWGMLKQKGDTEIHCGFTNREVELPQQSMSYKVWATRTKECLKKFGLATYITDDRPYLPPLLNFSEYSTAFRMLFSKRLYEFYFHALKEPKPGSLEHGDFQARAQILSRMMYDAWEDIPDVKHYHAKETWEYLEKKFGEIPRSGRAPQTTSGPYKTSVSPDTCNGGSSNLRHWLEYVWNDAYSRAEQ
ncbi:uncharacterized protein K452DRAFT_336248 [Aplosporella prunicola CBS 121167]|uniref:DUF6536 domain-containing protein n=1 Tax=Aplosporella prunicola CBS 121167 TaxID=1176127 RepID=A0A6A6B627_9PEZI|nr:uncharacterized protein K452DRAFT_336248 [Aplosporella prunicola CBS 121167]KAF2139582.1 hypothetical protein K452DRAFT_336248 [Aplosporella prunicola CBS 121167]